MNGTVVAVYKNILNKGNMLLKRKDMVDWTEHCRIEYHNVDLKPTNRVAQYIFGRYRWKVNGV